MSIFPKENEPLSVREYSKDHTYSSSAHNYVYAMITKSYLAISNNK